MARKPGQGKSQALWTEAEALERAGDVEGAVRLYVQAALAEEHAGEPVRARLLWERLATRGPVEGPLLERIATCCESSRSWDESFDFWRAAAARYQRAGRSADAQRARDRAVALRPRVAPHDLAVLALPAFVGEGADFIADLA